jgi:hypothetical protein
MGKFSSTAYRAFPVSAPRENASGAAELDLTRVKLIRKSQSL